MDLFKLGNINIKINLIAIIIIIIFSLIGYTAEVLIILICVLVHELSHGIVAKIRGFNIREIEIFPFGGIAKFDTMLGCDRANEIFIAAIGPLSNMIILLLFLLIKTYLIDNYITRFIIQLNMTMFIINLLPIFPLDGGRILRAVLSGSIGFKNATRILSFMTYFIAFFLIVYAFIKVSDLSNIVILLSFSIFLLLAAKKEMSMAAIIFSKDLMLCRKKILEKRIMKVRILAGLQTAKISEIVDKFLPDCYHIIIVIDYKGEIVEELSENEILRGITKFGMDITLEELLFNDKKW